jgi:predicted dehydrogenase
MLAAGPETRLAGVWARRPEAATSLAQRHGVEAAASFEALLERSEAIAFAVPPDVQAPLATIAARAGKPLLLEKPLALTLDGARELAAAVEAAGVVTQLVLSYRYRASTLAFLERARAFEAFGARAAFLTGGMLGGPYATPWRLEHGALLDLGPHVLDLLEGALGPIERIAATGDPRRWITVACTHAGGAVSEAAMSGVVAGDAPVFRFELYGPRGTLEFDARAAGDEDGWPRVRREFAAAVRAGRPHALDVRRGLRLQELIHAAGRAAR